MYILRIVYTGYARKMRMVEYTSLVLKNAELRILHLESKMDILVIRMNLEGR